MIEPPVGSILGSRSTRRRIKRHAPRRDPALADAARERLLARAAKAGEPGAVDELIEACTPAIAGMARRYGSSPAIHHDELVQAGVLGLLRALRRFDTSRGTPFWGYASWWVRQAMQELVAELAYAVVLSDRAWRDLARVHRAFSAHAAAHGREPSTPELAQACEMTVAHVDQLQRAERPGWSTGVDRAAEDDDFDRVEDRLAMTQLRLLPGGLSDRERSVVRARYGLGERKRSTDEIASAMGLSGERIRQIELRALGKIRRVALGPATPSSCAPRRRGTSAATPARSGGRAPR